MFVLPLNVTDEEFVFAGLKQEVKFGEVGSNRVMLCAKRILKGDRLNIVVKNYDANGKLIQSIVSTIVKETKYYKFFKDLDTDIIFCEEENEYF